MDDKPSKEELHAQIAVLQEEVSRLKSALENMRERLLDAEDEVDWLERSRDQAER